MPTGYSLISPFIVCHFYDLSQIFHDEGKFQLKIFKRISKMQHVYKLLTHKGLILS